MLQKRIRKGNSRNTVFDDGVHIEVTDNLACSKKRDKRLASRLGYGSCWRIRPLWSAGVSKGATQSAGDVIVDDCSSSTGGSS